jgi:hypothetical protein
MRQPWDFRRFVKTAAFYNAILPKLPFFSRLNKGKNRFDRNAVIWAQSGLSNSETRPPVEWGPLDDVVMGGVSKTDMNPGEAFTGVWTGYVSTSNNGGFAGIRTKLFKTPLDCSTCTGLKIKLTGDGQRLKFIIRDDDQWNGVAWSTSIDTKANQSTEVKIPFEKFQPTKYAKTLKDAGTFNKQQLTGMQLTLSKFEYDGALNPSFREGAFRVVLENVSTY